MKKIIMYGIGNQGKFNHYIFEKTQKSFEALVELFNNTLKTKLELYDEEYDEEYKNYTHKKILVKKLTDIHISSAGKNRLDIFYGKNKIFVTLFCPDKIRIKINEKLNKIAEMPKIKC